MATYFLWASWLFAGSFVYHTFEDKNWVVFVFCVVGAPGLFPFVLGAKLAERMR